MYRIFIHLYLKTCPVYMQYTDAMGIACVEVDELDAVAILIPNTCLQLCLRGPGPTDLVSITL